MKKILTALYLLLYCCPSVFADQQDELFQQANEAYQANDLTTAIELYQQIDSLGYQSPELEYNMANTYFQMGQKGKAVLHYERAFLLAPNDEDVLYNLSIAQQQVKNREQLPDFFLTDLWNNMRLAMSSDGWFILAELLWWVGFAGLGLWLLGKSRVQRKFGFWVGMTAILLSLLPFALSWSRMSLEQNSGAAIVLADQSSLKSAPDEAGSEILKLNEGEKVFLLDHLGEYWQVQLTNGEKGWVAESKVEQI